MLYQTNPKTGEPEVVLVASDPAVAPSLRFYATLKSAEATRRDALQEISGLEKSCVLRSLQFADRMDQWRFGNRDKGNE